MTPDLRFRVGSITKTFVAALVLSLVEDGLIRLDHPVERWLPGVVPGGGTITVRHLLNHTSGLPDYVESAHRRRSTQALAADGARRARPGARWHEPRRRAVRVREHELRPPRDDRRGGRWTVSRRSSPRGFLEPLGLSRTSFEPGIVRGSHVPRSSGAVALGVVTGQAVDIGDEPARGGRGPRAESSRRLRTCSGSSPRCSAGELLSARSMREMATLVPAGRQRYGLGLAVFPTPCEPAWGPRGTSRERSRSPGTPRDASRQVVLVVSSYPLSAELEEAVRELQLAAFCGA